MAATTVTSMTELSARLRAEDTPTPPATAAAANDHASVMDTSSPATPTRHSFGGLLGQRPLPSGSMSTAGIADSQDHSHHHHHGDDDDDDRADSTQPGQDQDIDDDVDMEEIDAETVGDDEFSDNDSITGEKPSKKKKKGQRFFCTDFPPCQLSFTRSEHLARHIRKHTGERPFQCHCSRRFSRLDNLRQHAQTVHVNEEIPGDSLAATSTRFQRQIRTDRVRPSSSRSRGSTINGQQTPTHSRGHSRNLSASSIGSVASSTFTASDDRRRPPSLAIATEGLKRSHDMTEDEIPSYYPRSTTVTTPTSAFSVNMGSPGYHNSYASPSRSSSYFSGGPRHNRRLSVPSSSNPYQPHNPGYAPGFYTPMSSQASAYSSQQTSGYASPSGSIVSPGRRDSETDIEYRRRTWHPSSQSSYNSRPPTSGLLFHQTPDQPVPSLSSQPAASQLPRLPGIESFDHVPPPTSVRPQADTSMLNAMSRPASSYDSGIQQGFNRLEITPNAMPPEPQWPQAQPQYAPLVPVQHHYQHQHQHHLSMPDVPSTPRRNKRQAWYGGPVGPGSVGPAPALQPPQFQALRPSPEDSGSSDGGGVPTPLTFQGQEYHPAIANPNDPVTVQADQYRKVRPYPQQNIPSTYDKPTMPPRADSGFGPFQVPGPMTALSQQVPLQSTPYTLQAGHDARFANGYMQVRPERPGNDMGRLEALVAVATSENRAVEGQR